MMTNEAEQMMQQQTEAEAQLQGLQMEQDTPQVEHMLALLETDLPDESGLKDMLEAILGRDHALSNLQEREVWEDKYLGLNDFEVIKMMFPRRESIYAVPWLRQIAIGDQRPPLSDASIRNLRALRRVGFKRSARSRGGWQQDKIHDSTNVSILEGSGSGRAKKKSIWKKLLG